MKILIRYQLVVSLLVAAALHAQAAAETYEPVFQPTFATGRSGPFDTLFSASWATAKKTPTRPKMGKDFWGLVAVQSVATVWDVELTQRRMRQDPLRHEANPFLPRRPGRGRMYGQFFAANVVADYAAWRLRHAGHRHWARVVQIGSIAIYGYCIAYNATHPTIYQPGAGWNRPLTW